MWLCTARKGVNAWYCRASFTQIKCSICHRHSQIQTPSSQNETYLPSCNISNHCYVMFASILSVIDVLVIFSSWCYERIRIEYQMGYIYISTRSIFFRLFLFCSCNFLMTTNFWSNISKAVTFEKWNRHGIFIPMHFQFPLMRTNNALRLL